MPTVNPLHGPLDPTAYAERLKKLELRSGLSSTQFKSAFRRISKVVNKLYALHEHDRVFKGKWYAPLLVEQIKTIPGTSSKHFQGLSGRLPSTIVLTLDFSLPWAEYFKEPLLKVASLL